MEDYSTCLRLGHTQEYGVSLYCPSLAACFCRAFAVGRRTLGRSVLECLSVVGFASPQLEYVCVRTSVPRGLFLSVLSAVLHIASADSGGSVGSLLFLMLDHIHLWDLGRGRSTTFLVGYVALAVAPVLSLAYWCILG